MAKKQEQEIEKAKWTVGMQFTRNGKTYECTGFSDTTGRPTWKLVNGKRSTSNTNNEQPAGKKTASADDEGGSKKQPEVKTDEGAKKQESKYDAPTPKIEYKTKRPADGIVFEVPETFMQKDKGGKLVKRNRSSYRKAYSQMEEDKLLKILNNHGNIPEVRQLAYEEAVARGIDEDKIDVSGSLEERWDHLKEKRDLFAKKEDDEEDEDSMEVYDTTALRGMDPEQFVADNFTEGDDGWRSRDNDIIRREFNGFKSLADRKRYDAFLDYMNRLDPFYRNPKQQMQGLNILFNTFIHGKSPLMVSAGGAGAGKTTGFLKVAGINELKRFDPDHNKPGDGDYDYYVVEKDIQDDKDFEKLLSEHNGKIIVFDDKDRLLTTNANKLIGLMKGIADGNPSMRIFHDPATGQQKKFTGKLLFLTNKSMDTLQKDEDHTAIMSRAMKHDIRMTINENLELLAERYKTIGKEEVSFEDPAEESYYREQLWKLIKRNKDRLDPDKFTVRKFTEALKTIKGVIDANKLAAENEDAAAAFGEERDWKIEVLQMLNKAVVYTDFQDMEEVANLDKKSLRAQYKRDPKSFVEIYGDEFIKLLNGEDPQPTDEEIEEAFMTDIGNMSIEEAENLLFN